MLEIVLLHNLGVFAGDNSDYRAMTPANKEDGALAEENDKLKEAMKLMEKNI